MRGRPRKPLIPINGVMHRHCGSCKKLQPLENFSRKKKKNPDTGTVYYTWESYCRPCNQEYQKEYRIMQQEQW